MEPASTQSGKRTFRYEARHADGQAITGSIDAASHDQAMAQLLEMRLEVLDIRDVDRPVRGGAMSTADLQTFNQHLTYLTEAGLPVESGLRMIAREASSKRIGETILQIADETERGKTLAEAVATHRDKFPALYSQLIDAGLKSANLPGMLLNLGRHLALVNQLRSALWRVLAYPLILVVVVMLLIAMLGIFVLPEFEAIFDDFGTELPSMTQMLMSFGQIAPVILVVFIALVILVPAAVGALRYRGYGPVMVDALVLPMPVLGGIMRRNLTARWCDAVNIGVQAGVDLPRSIRLASDAIASPAVIRDSDEILDALQTGRPLTDLPHLRILPDIVPHAIEISKAGDGLSTSLQALTAMNIEQAEMRIQVMAVYLPVIMLMLIGLVLVPTVMALFLPMVKLITSLT